MAKDDSESKRMPAIMKPSLATMREHFQRRFGAPERLHLVRAPGRVNLIGEHTDYNGYPVLPIAIDRSIRFLAGPSGDRSVAVVTLDPHYSERAFLISNRITLWEQGDWGNYIKSAIKELLESGLAKIQSFLGFQAIISGDIPQAAGLSSSSSLIVASALVSLAMNEIHLDRVQLADHLARAERFVGTEGGGMDQAVSLLAEESHALLIDFFPLRARPVPVPAEYGFVICNSLVRAAKTESARYEFNRRVVECRLAAHLVKKALERRTNRELDVNRLGDLTQRKLGIPDGMIRSVAEETLSRPFFTLEEISRASGSTVDEIARTHFRLRDGSLFTPLGTGFALWKRYRHVVSEARRVHAAVDALGRKEMRVLGDLMNASHDSCRDDFEISCPELEELVSLARKHGATGARLTGAGFGGCTVNLLPRGDIPSFVENMKRHYYREYLATHPSPAGFLTADLDTALFVCRPSAGATVERI